MVDPSTFMKFFNYKDLIEETVVGNVNRVIYTGENIQIIEYHFPPNKVFPLHKHDEHEQMGYLIKGKMGFVVDGEETVLEAGDYYHAQIGVEHNAWTFDEPAILLDIFSPPREDLIKGD